MKSIYLVRHAKSSWDYPELSDFERPLNKRGRKDAPKIGKLLRSKGFAPERIISSPANRAITTARLISAELGFPLERIQAISSLYTFGNTQAAEDEIYSTSNSLSSLMLVAHNESITELANLLASEAIGHMVTCAVVRLDFDVDSWTKIVPGEGHVVLNVYPKMLS